MFKRKEKTPPDEWLKLAFDQASCLHQHSVALNIVMRAVALLNVNSAKQRKRLYPEPQDPTRIYLKDMHVLQHLVFLVSEEHERNQETSKPDSIREADMIIRYLAFIIRKSLKRSSVYGVTGICRFICQYTMKHVQGIHEALGRDDRNPSYLEDSSFRHNRARMRRWIQKRFLQYLSIEEVENGKEKHFKLRDQQDDLSQLIRKTLDLFKPWNTACLPSGFNPREDKLSPSTNPDPHVLELRRLHALIHPDCFEILTRGLGFDAQESRLGIPQFFSVNSGSENPPAAGSLKFAAVAGSGNDDDDGPMSEVESLDFMKKACLEEHERLRRFVAKGMLTVRVDGQAVSAINLDETNRVEFTLDPQEAELIEVVAEDQQLVLAVHLLDDDEVAQLQNRKQIYVVRHDSGASVTFCIERLGAVGSDSQQLSVAVAYNKARFAGALGAVKPRLASGLASVGLTIDSWRASGSLAPVMINWTAGSGPSWLNHHRLAPSLSLISLFFVAVLVVLLLRPGGPALSPAEIATIKPDPDIVASNEFTNETPEVFPISGPENRVGRYRPGKLNARSGTRSKRHGLKVDDILWRQKLSYVTSIPDPGIVASNEFRNETPEVLPSSGPENRGARYRLGKLNARLSTRSERHRLKADDILSRQKLSYVTSMLLKHVEVKSVLVKEGVSKVSLSKEDWDIIPYGLLQNDLPNTKGLACP